MTKRLDQILVIDIECTCWDGTPPPHEQTEVIEIGVCRLDVTTLARLEKRSLLVRPERSHLSEFCRKLTTISPEMLADALTFSQACQVLRDEYDSARRVWASYGDYDRIQMEKQCEDWKVKYPFSPTHWNVKNLLALWAKWPRELGLAQALAYLDLPLEGTHHRGHDDAWNTAAILAMLISKLRGNV